MPANEVKIQTIPTDMTDQPNTKLWMNLAYVIKAKGVLELANLMKPIALDEQK